MKAKISGALSITLSLIACGRPEPEPAAPAAAPAEHAPASTSSGLQVPDARAPVPLLPQMAAHQREQMRDHLLVVQEVTSAMAREDFDAAARSAARLGTSESMTAMCTHMGAGAPGFTERALDMHRRADVVAEAARAGDRAATLEALAGTLSACTSCHAAYREEIVDPVRWTELTGGAALH